MRAAGACNFTCQSATIEHKVLTSLGYGEMVSSKGEEMNPAVIDLSLQSASSASR